MTRLPSLMTCSNFSQNCITAHETASLMNFESMIRLLAS
jgi:hypothetical protein